MILCYLVVLYSVVFVIAAPQFLTPISSALPAAPLTARVTGFAVFLLMKGLLMRQLPGAAGCKRCFPARSCFFAPRHQRQAVGEYQ